MPLNRFTNEDSGRRDHHDDEDPKNDFDRVLHAQERYPATATTSCAWVCHRTHIPLMGYVCDDKAHPGEMG